MKTKPTKPTMTGLSDRIIDRALKREREVLLASASLFINALGLDLHPPIQIDFPDDPPSPRPFQDPLPQNPPLRYNPDELVILIVDRVLASRAHIIAERAIDVFMHRWVNGDYQLEDFENDV